MGVSGRGVLSGTPAKLCVDGRNRLEIVGWAGPWIVEERWWDPTGSRRRARLQVQVVGGAAYLVALEAGAWWLDAGYD